MHKLYVCSMMQFYTLSTSLSAPDGRDRPSPALLRLLSSLPPPPSSQAPGMWLSNECKWLQASTTTWWPQNVHGKRPLVGEFTPPHSICAKLRSRPAPTWLPEVDSWCDILRYKSFKFSRVKSTDFLHVMYPIFFGGRSHGCVCLLVFYYE